MPKGTKLSAEPLGTNVTRQGFWGSVTLITQEMRHQWEEYWACYWSILPKCFLNLNNDSLIRSFFLALWQHGKSIILMAKHQLLCMGHGTWKLLSECQPSLSSLLLLLLLLLLLMLLSIIYYCPNNPCHYPIRYQYPHFFWRWFSGVLRVPM